MSENLYGHIERAGPRDLDAVVLEDDTGRSFSWRQVHLTAARYAGVLRERGAVPGDRVVVQVDKSPDSLFLYLGCLRAGLTYVPLNTAYQRGELSYFLSDAEPAVTVCRSQSEREMLAIGVPAEKLLTLDADGLSKRQIPRKPGSAWAWGKRPWWVSSARSPATRASTPWYGPCPSSGRCSRKPGC